MKLYRGYLAKVGVLPNTRSESTINIQEKIRDDPKFNPRDRDFVDKLLWVSPNREYAWKVAFSRFVASAVFDRNARVAILKGELIPALAVFEVGEDTDNLFNVSAEDEVTSFKGYTEQMIVQKIDAGTVVTEHITPASRESLLRSIFETTGREDTILRICAEFEKITGKEFPNYRYKELKDTSLVEGITSFFDWCWGDFDEDKLPEVSDLVEITARAIFSRTVGIESEYEVRTLEEGEVYKPYIVKKEKTYVPIESSES